MLRSFRYFLHFFVVAFIPVLLCFSCTRNNTHPALPSGCDTLVCLHNGACDGATGNCVCDPGYEGLYCETLSRQKFLGFWNVTEKGSLTQDARYPVSIQAAAQEDMVTIQNFNNYFIVLVSATITADSIFIPSQLVEGKIVQGIGYVYSSVLYGHSGAIKLRYQVIDTATAQVNDYGYAPSSGSESSRWIIQR